MNLSVLDDSPATRTRWGLHLAPIQMMLEMTLLLSEGCLEKTSSFTSKLMCDHIKESIAFVYFIQIYIILSSGQISGKLPNDRQYVFPNITWRQVLTYTYVYIYVHTHVHIRIIMYMKAYTSWFCYNRYTLVCICRCSEYTYTYN